MENNFLKQKPCLAPEKCTPEKRILFFSGNFPPAIVDIAPLAQDRIRKCSCFFCCSDFPNTIFFKRVIPSEF